MSDEQNNLWNQFSDNDDNWLMDHSWVSSGIQEQILTNFNKPSADLSPYGLRLVKVKASETTPAGYVLK